MAKKENNYYFDAFEKGLSYANDAAVLLNQCFENYDLANVQAHLDEMHEIEHKADKVKHEMMERLVKEFLPPIEREDIVEMSRIIDDVTDAIEDVLRGMYMYNISSLRSEVKDFTNVIARCCSALIEAAKEFHNFRKSDTLREKIIEINALEEEGDRIFHKAVHDLYVVEKDPIAVISWTTMYKRMEQCCDCCEDVADMFEQVIMKNS